MIVNDSAAFQHLFLHPLQSTHTPQQQLQLNHSNSNGLKNTSSLLLRRHHLSLIHSFSFASTPSSSEASSTTPSSARSITTLHDDGDGDAGEICTPSLHPYRRPAPHSHDCQRPDRDHSLAFSHHSASSSKSSHQHPSRHDHHPQLHHHYRQHYHRSPSSLAFSDLSLCRPVFVSSPASQHAFTTTTASSTTTPSSSRANPLCFAASSLFSVAKQLLSSKTTTTSALTTTTITNTTTSTNNSLSEHDLNNGEKCDIMELDDVDKKMQSSNSSAPPSVASACTTPSCCTCLSSTCSLSSSSSTHNPSNDNDIISSSLSQALTSTPSTTAPLSTTIAAATATTAPSSSSSSLTASTTAAEAAPAAASPSRSSGLVSSLSWESALMLVCNLVSSKWNASQQQLLHQQHQSSSRSVSRDITPFHSSVVPSVPISEYLQLLCRRTRCSLATVLFTGVYLVRLHEREAKLVDDVLCAHRLVLASFVVASKFCDDDDQRYNNKCVAGLGGVDTRELNDLECELLTRLQFHLFVDEATLTEFCTAAKAAKQTNIGTAFI